MIGVIAVAVVTVTGWRLAMGLLELATDDYYQTEATVMELIWNLLVLIIALKTL